MKKTSILFTVLLLTLSINISFGDIAVVERPTPPTDGKVVRSPEKVDPGDLILGLDILKKMRKNPALAEKLRKDLGKIDPNTYYTKDEKTKKWKSVGKQADSKDFEAETGSKEDTTKPYIPTKEERTVYDAETGQPLAQRDIFGDKQTVKNEATPDGLKLITTDEFGNKAVYNQVPANKESAKTAFEFYDKDGNLIHSLQRPDAMVEWISGGQKTSKDQFAATILDGDAFLFTNLGTEKITDGYFFHTPETQGKNIYTVTKGATQKVYFDENGKFLRAEPFKK